MSTTEEYSGSGSDTEYYDHEDYVHPPEDRVLEMEEEEVAAALTRMKELQSQSDAIHTCVESRINDPLN